MQHFCNGSCVCVGLLKPTVLTPSNHWVDDGRRRGGQIDDSPYSSILARQDDFYYKGFADWCATHDGALPRRDGTTSGERSLASWFRHKLRLYYSDDLSDEELVKLKKIPAIHEHFSLHGQWSLKFVVKNMNFEDWCAKHRRLLPQQGEERSLADWLKNAISHNRHGHNGKHSENQVPYLRKISVPVDLDVFSVKNKSLSRSECFDLKCKSFEDWCAQHGGSLPKKKGDTQEERSLAIWFKNKLFGYRRSKLSDDQLAQLRKIPAISHIFSVSGKSFRSGHFALKCEKFQDWCAQHGGSLPKQKGDTQEERSLGDWLMYKLRRYRQGKLSDDQLAQLRKIPAISHVFSVEGDSFGSFEHFALKCKSFEDWCAQHGGSLPKERGDTQEERSLAIWFKNKLFGYRRSKLSDDQLAQLRKIPAISHIFSVSGKSFRSGHFALKCEKFQDWCAQHGGSLPKQKGDTQEERSLGDWLMYKLRRYRQGKLSEDQRAQLRKIPAISQVFSVEGESFRSEHFALKCERIEDWCAQHGGSLPKQEGDTREERSLAIWFKNKLFGYRRGKLSEDQLAQLRKIPAISQVFSVEGESFRSKHFVLKCERFEDWCAQHGGALPKQEGDTREERSLAIWFKNKLSSYRHGKLSVDQQAKLREIPVISEVLHYKGFAEWCATHDGALPRRDGSTSEERSLASWFRHNLRLYYSDDLSDEDILRLKKIPAISDLFSLHGRSLSFALKCKSFEDWCIVHNGNLPKQSGETVEQRSLANWLKRQISNYRQGMLSEEQMVRLRKILPGQKSSSGLKVDYLSRSVHFHFKCKGLEEWCAAHNGTLPKQNAESQQERSLAVWLTHKLSSYRGGKLPDDQLTRLRMIPGVSERLEKGVS